MREQTGLLIIRAWGEPGSLKPLRAQIRRTANVSAGLEREFILVEIDAVAAAVESWLLDVLGAGGASPEEQGLGPKRHIPIA